MREYYSYESFKKDTNLILQEIVSFEPQAIVAIARGGLTLAHAFAEGMNIRDVQSIRTELYDDISKRKEITLFGDCYFETHKRVLVADDIADSGETLQAVMNYLEEKFPNIEFKSATLFYKKTSIYEPHYWINEAHNWIEFFWEKDFL